MKKHTTGEKKKKVTINFKSIALRMMVGILPITALAVLALTVISGQVSKAIIREQMEERMMATLTAQTNTITSQLALVSSTSNNLAGAINASYETGNAKTFSSSLAQTVSGSSILYSAGLYFSEQSLGAPYAYRDGQAILNGSHEGDYQHEQFYMDSLSKVSTFYAPVEYNAEAGKMILKAVTPMADSNYHQIGAAVAEMDMSLLKASIEEIKIGDNGDVLLVSDTGAFLAGVDDARVVAGDLITSDSDFASVAGKIMSEDSGSVKYSKGGELYSVYYGTIPTVNWKLLVRVPSSQIEAPVSKLVSMLIIVGVITLVLCVVAIMLQVGNISSGIKKVNKFANILADGDFTVDEPNSKRVDELGSMNSALKKMYRNNKEILTKISDHAGAINGSSTNLYSATEELSRQFEDIENLVTQVNDDMMNASAATQEVNASAEEVTASVNVLAEETNGSQKMTEEIKQRALSVEKTSKDAHDYAISLSEEYNKNLARSIEDAEVVESIGKLAEVISDIASQINLLSLNASIEAARAGEAGRGFSVVATEIGKLAGDTSAAVAEIHTTIDEVKEAFSLLTKNSESLLTFIKETVTPDYDNFVGIAKQYGADAAAIEASSARISDMAGNIEKIMMEVATAVQNITKSTENTADSSAHIASTVGMLAEVVEQVSAMSEEQEKIATDLNDVVSHFKL